jgi:predicted RNA-binding Zn ribbon-like protein
LRHETNYQTKQHESTGVWRKLNSSCRVQPRLSRFVDRAGIDSAPCSTASFPPKARLHRIAGQIFINSAAPVASCNAIELPGILQCLLLPSNRLDGIVIPMAKTAMPKTVTAMGKRVQSRRSAGTLIPRELIARQVGGHLALDFCNTAGEHLAAQPDELLRDWESFLRWATQVGLVGPESYFELLGHPEPLDEIIRLREAIYRVGLAAAGARRFSRHDVVLIRQRASAFRPGIEFRDNAGRWRPAPSHASEQLCAVLAGEALSLLCSPKVAKIGVCDGGNCGWLFLDESRGKRRRWCDMGDCGSRAKARRYYEKHKGS